MPAAPKSKAEFALRLAIIVIAGPFLLALKMVLPTDDAFDDLFLRIEKGCP